MSAAIELFDEQGYEATTVAEIAERAGLTKRTFFRYFSDKREVLFSGSQELQRLWLEGLAAAPAQGPVGHWPSWAGSRRLSRRSWIPGTLGRPHRRRGRRSCSWPGCC